MESDPKKQMSFKNIGEKSLDYWILRVETMSRRMEKEVEITRKRAAEMEKRASIQEEMVKDMLKIHEELIAAKESFAFNLNNEAWQLVEREKYTTGVALRKSVKENKKLLDEIEVLRSQLDKKSRSEVQSSSVAINRAKTFAIVDSILFAIENWAFDDSPAPDITLASQATIFPVVFEKVSSGDENYYLTEVPHTAIEVVRRGREFVRDFREREHISVLDPAGWEVLQPLLHSWWTRDAIPLLYGQGYEGWEFEEPYSREQMTRWRTMEAARPLEFPLIFDGMELVKKYGDEIREETGLPQFSRETMTTRIQAHD